MYVNENKRVTHYILTSLIKKKKKVKRKPSIH